MTDTTSLPDEFALLQQELSRLTDRRFARGKVFPLAGVLCLAVLSLMCGYRSLSAIHRFGDTHPELWTQLQLPRSPSVPTLSRLLRMVSVGELRQALMRFALELALQRGCGVGVVAMDGKTMGGVREGGEAVAGTASIQPGERGGPGSGGGEGSSGRTTGGPGLDRAGGGTD